MPRSFFFPLLLVPPSPPAKRRNHDKKQRVDPDPRYWHILLDDDVVVGFKIFLRNVLEFFLLEEPNCSSSSRIHSPPKTS